MAAQPMNLTLQSSKEEAPNARLLILKPEHAWLFIPGQVAVLSMEALGEAYFAMASAPHDKEGLEFLVRKGGPVAEALYAARPGAKVQAKGPVGKGFPVDSLLGRDIVLACVGTAIAPMRSVLRAVSARRSDFGKIVLLYGQRHPDEFAFVRETEDWREKGIKVDLIVSRPEGYEWKGTTGHVQEHFAAALEGLPRPVALIAGMKAMVEQGRTEFLRLGVAPNEVLTNY